MLPQGGAAWPGGGRTLLPSLGAGNGGAALPRAGRAVTVQGPGGTESGAPGDGLPPSRAGVAEGAWAADTAGSGWSVASSARTWTPQVEARVRQAAGRELHALRTGDLQRSQQLKLELQQLKLNDYFDSHGSPRFKRLGISFAAKQHDEIRDSFGSRMDDLSGGAAHRHCSARAAHRATEAVEKDALNTKSRTRHLLGQLSSVDRHLVKDVRERQLEMLFSEVPGFANYIPPNVQPVDLLPADVNKEEESKERRIAERWNGYFADRFWIEGAKMSWLLQRGDVLQVNEAFSMWARAERGGNCALGVTRSGFCRFLMDNQLVDQQRVPYFWAVSLFDSVSRPMHLCPPDATWAMTAPATYVVNRWTLVSVLDLVLRQHYDEKSYGSFTSKLLRAVKHFLPSHARADLKKDSASSKTPVEQDDARSSLGTPMPASEASSAFLETTPSRATVVLSPASLEGASGTSSVPLWLRPPERSSSSLDHRHERQLRDRVIQSMLIEPEVLNVTMQYLEIFRKLHRCYADADGHMDFTELLKFCTDFRLTPELVTSEFLKTIYDAVVCLEWAAPILSSSGGPQKAPLTQREAPPEEKRGSLLEEKRGSLQVPRTRKGQERVSRADVPAADVAEGQVLEVLGVFGVGAFMEALCRAAFMYLGFYGNSVQQSTGGYSRVVWLVAYLRYAFARLSASLERRRSAGARVVEGPLTNALQAVPLQAWEQPACPEFRVSSRVVQPLPGVGFKKSKRRKVATRPIKLKPSQATLSKMKASAKALIFAERLHKKATDTKMARLPEETDGESEAGPMSTSTPSSDEDLHEELPMKSRASLAVVADAVPRLQSSPEQVPPLADEGWALEDLMKAEAGQPSIVAGTCTLCGTEVDKFAWGNPRCRGCSVIDAMALDHHPFKHLLVEKERAIKVSRPKAKRPAGGLLRRDDLTPPPVEPEARQALRARGHATLQVHSART